MHVVALTKLGRPIDAEAAVLAEWLGVSAYDLRLRVQAGLPAMLYTCASAPDAQAFSTRLRERGHGAVSCDLALARTEDASVVRELELAPGLLRGRDSQGAAFETRDLDVLSLIRATSIRDQESTVTTRVQNFAAGRALLSGGLMMTKTAVRTTQTQEQMREQVLYLFRREALAPLVFRESSLRYQGLFEALKPTAMQNFLLLIERLRERSPAALYEQRFLQQKRKPGLSVSGTAAARTVSSSNDAETQLAAFALTLAHVEGQL